MIKNHANTSCMLLCNRGGDKTHSLCTHITWKSIAYECARKCLRVVLVNDRVYVLCF